MLRDEDKKLKTEDFDDDFKIHYYKKALPVDRGRDEEASVVVFEKKKDFDASKAFVFNHGATSIADEKEYRKEARAILNDDEFTRDEQKQMSDFLRDRGERYDDMPLSYLESRKLESAVDSWRRMRYWLGASHPRFTACVSYGDKGLYILAPDSQGKKIKNATVENHNKLVDEALTLVKSEHTKLWSISHSLGGLNSLAILMDQAKTKSNRISKALLVDMMLFPGDMNASMFAEILLRGNIASFIVRYLVQLMLHETEWREINPLGKNFKELLNFPRTHLHTNEKSMFPFDIKHNEIMSVVDDLGAYQITQSITATSHSFMPGKLLAEFFSPPKQPAPPVEPAKPAETSTVIT